MISRRNLILGAATNLLCAPLVVRAASLMSVRSVTLSNEAVQFGFVSRLYRAAQLVIAVRQIPRSTLLCRRGRPLRRHRCWSSS